MKKFLKILGVLIVSFSFSSLFAQNVSLGIRGGISIPNLSASGSNENPLNTGYKSRLGPDASIFANFKISPLFSIRPMVEYSSQGGKKTGMQAFPTPPQYQAMFPAGSAPTYLYANFKSEAKLNYLLVAVLAQFGWNFGPASPFRVYVDAGPFAGFLLSAKQVTSGSSLVYADASGQQPFPIPSQSFDSTNNIKDQLNKFNAGAEANIGLSYNVGNGNIFIEGGFNYGFLNIQKGTANGKNNTGAGTVSLGYAHTFGK
jgi:hypothetical protein